jgi:hypothetical protein
MGWSSRHGVRGLDDGAFVGDRGCARTRNIAGSVWRRRRRCRFGFDDKLFDEFVHEHINQHDDDVHDHDDTASDVATADVRELQSELLGLRAERVGRRL